MLEDGLGVALNAKSARSLLVGAADLGHQWAKFILEYRDEIEQDHLGTKREEAKSDAYCTLKSFHKRISTHFVLPFILKICHIRNYSR